HIGVRSICAGIAAIAVGVALESAGRHRVGARSVAPPPASSTRPVLEKGPPPRLDPPAAPARGARLEQGVVSQAAAETSAPSPSASAAFGDRFSFDEERVSFGERFVFDRKLASFNERFGGADASRAATQESTGSVLGYARAPSLDAEERAIANSATTQ